MNLVARLEQYRSEQQKLGWQGTFKEYFELVSANPRVAQLSHARIYDMLVSAGVEANHRSLAASFRRFASQLCTRSTTRPSTSSRQ